jgi:quinol monooxygenase YgiN
MRPFARRLAASVLTAALAVLVSSTAYGQDSPVGVRLAEIRVRAGQSADFEALAKLSNEASKKFGIPWRQTWSVSQFGEGGVYYLVSPVKNFAQFDEKGPLSTLSVEDRLTYANLARNAVESAHYKLLELAADLSLRSDGKDLPKLARVTVVHALPGKAADLEATIKDLLLPALKAAGVKDFWVHRTILGGQIGEYTYVLLFDKWADLDALGSMQKILGDNYAKYMARVAASIQSGEIMIIKLDPKLTYMPEK